MVIMGYSIPQWEAVCKHCGDCCKLPNGDMCPHNDPITHLCDLYPHNENTSLPQNTICRSILRHYYETRGHTPSRCAYRPILNAFFHKGDH